MELFQRIRDWKSIRDSQKDLEKSENYVVEKGHMEEQLLEAKGLNPMTIRT